MGQNFSWLKQVGHELEQQWATNLRNAVRRICVKIECRWLCKPIRSQSNCQLIHKNKTYVGKELGLMLNEETFALRLSSVEEIDPSSSSRKPTSRQWWSDWILENKRSSPESFLVLILQEQFYTSELFKVVQDAIPLILLYRTMTLFRTVFLKYIYHVGCAINLHSIINSGLTPGGQNLSNR